MSSSDDAILIELQRRLKPPGGGKAPNMEHLAVALLLARNPALEPRSVWRAHNVSGSGDTRKRIVGWRDRIIKEELLSACADILQSHHSPTDVIKSLIVPESLWQKNVPTIDELWYDTTNPLR